MGKKVNTSRKQAAGRKRTPAPARLEIGIDQLRAIVERTRSAALSEVDHARLAAAIDTLAFVTQELEATGANLERLRKLLFGSTSEKTKTVLDEKTPRGGPSTGEPVSGAAAEAASGSPEREAPPKPPAKGHGRHAASDYVGAVKEPVSHASLSHQDCCPGCSKGKVYRQAQPGLLVRVTGVGPLQATRYELERLRCNLCGELFTADPPPGVGDEKYDASAVAMIGLLRYGCGLPLNRIEKLGTNLGIPLPASTQSELVSKAADDLEPVWNQLIHEAAQGEVFRIDDTKARILELNTQLQKDLAAGRTKRSGIFTSGVVSTIDDRTIALFFTGRKHAGENLEKVLRQRSPKLPLPIQMGDAASKNTAGDFEALVAGCLAHARRHFVDVASHFPEEVRHVLETLGSVYGHDAKAREAGLSPEARLAYHQEQSAPLMTELAAWLQQRFDARLVEPNSSLGRAIKYMQNHWEKLTLFLREPGAPLDNNLCERVLKRSILHRKNSLFYKTTNGAHVGDVFMSLIHTAELSKIEPFPYLVALQQHRKAVEADPASWLPWTYQKTLAEQRPP